MKKMGICCKRTRARINVTAYWELGGQRGEETAETFRYAPLFQQAAQ